MRRSEIDRRIEGAIALLEQHGIALPPQARWDLRAHHERRANAVELARRGIGWDLTDFGLGDFDRHGLLLYTLSNGVLGAAIDDQPYAHKLLVVQEGQVTPRHHHERKTEDIAVLAGGWLEVEVHHVRPGGESADVSLLVDNARVTLASGASLRLGPGQRVRLEPCHDHRFRAIPAFGPVVAQEVSSVNDDAADNLFHPEAGVSRFPQIEEDVAPRYLLCTELPGTDAFARLAARWLGE